MQKISQIIWTTFIVIIMAVGIIFILQNSNTKIILDLSIFGRFEIHVFLLSLYALLTGFILALLMTVPSLIRLTFTNKKANKKLKEIEEKQKMKQQQNEFENSEVTTK